MAPEHYNLEDMPKSEVVTIQYLRAVAAIGVVIFHIGEVFHFHLQFGATGVDVFFVVSGFIMWMVSRQREASASKFVKKRLVRIVPLYWLVTIFLATCAHLRPNLFPLDHPSTGHVLLSLLFLPHLGPDGELYPMVTQGWTLNYEMFFYFLFAVTLARFRKYQFYALTALLLGSILCGYLIHPSSPAGEAYTSPLLMEFLAGIYICRAWLDKTVLSRKAAWTAIAMGVAGITATYVLNAPLPRVIGSGVPAALIVLGAVSLEGRKSVPKIAVLKMLGDASYSIYLTHWFAWVAVSIGVAKLGGSLSLATYCVTICAAIIGGMATYVFVERPTSKFIARIADHPGKRIDKKLPWNIKH
jgi:exopolysaccharide production protein ExoZ